MIAGDLKESVETYNKDDEKPASYIPTDPETLKLFNRYGIYLLFDEITKQSAESAVEFIIGANLKHRYYKSKKHVNIDEYEPLEHLTLVINSYGGDLSDAFSIIAAMQGSTLPIHTVGMGIVASSGLLIFIAGKKGYRLMTPNAAILSHQWANHTTYSKEHELQAMQKDWKQTSIRMTKHYRECTGLSNKIIRTQLLPPQDVWLTPQESKRFRLCDKVGIWNFK